MKNKYLTLILVVVMLVSTLVGCGGGGNKTSNKGTDGMLYVEIGGATPSGLEDWTNLACVEEWKERLGVEINCDGLVDTDWATKKTLMIAEDNLPDIIINGGFTIEEAVDYGEQGYFLDFNEYLDIMPNLSATFDKYPEYKAYLTSEDGAIYGLTQIRSDYTDRLQRTFIKKEWLDNLGLEVPTTLDELYKVMVAFKTKDANGNGDPNDEVPVLWGPKSGYGGFTRTVMDAFGIYGSGGGNNHYILEVNNGVVGLAQTTDRYKAFLKWMKKCFDEGLIESEAFTIEAAVAEKKGREDLYGIFGTGAAPYVFTNSAPSTDKEWAAVMGLKSEWNPDSGVSVEPYLRTSIDLLVNSNVEDPEAICKFIDYFYSEEGMLAGALGYEGQFFNWEDHELLGTIPVWNIVPEGYENAEDYRVRGSVLGGFNLHETHADRVAMFKLDNAQLYDDELVTEYGWVALLAQGYTRVGVTPKDTYPNLIYSLNEGKEVTTLKVDVSNYIEQKRAEFFTGQTDIDAGWDEYVNTCYTMGLKRLLEIEQNVYDRANK